MKRFAGLVLLLHSVSASDNCAALDNGAEETSLLQIPAPGRGPAPPSPPLSVAADDRLTAYWEAGRCGPQGNDHNARTWCGGVGSDTNGVDPYEHCQTEVATDICDSGAAELVDIQGTGRFTSVTINNCAYAYYAQYRCAVPAPVDDESWCATQCQAAGHCCNDPNVGSNQQISCAQACMMRASGQRMDLMLTANDGICNRRGNSGCTLVVQDQSYSFCQRCQDLQDHCPHGVQSSDECDFGASLLPPSVEQQCSGTFEAEDATVSGAVEHANTASPGHQGFTGRSFVDYLARTGDFVEWTVQGCSGGSATASFRYALGSGNRPMQVIVNGAEVESALSFPPTGSWASWSEADFTVSLNAGTNVVKLVASGSSGANMDSLIIH